MAASLRGRRTIATTLLRHHPRAQGHLAEVDEGEIVTLIGANGAGKTTTLRTISGLDAPPPGEVASTASEIDRLAAARDRRARHRQAPEGRRIFPRMTVLENLEMGAFARRDAARSRRTWSACSSSSRA